MPQIQVQEVPQAVNIADLAETVRKQSTTIERLCERIEQLESEQKLTATTIAVNLVIEDEKTQALIQDTNSLLERIKSHARKEMLERCLTQIVGKLNRQIEVLIPLSSHLYRPHQVSTISLELGHESLHLSEHIVHIVAKNSKTLKTLIRQTPTIIGVGHAASELMPVLAFGMRILEMLNEHRLIHEAEHKIKQILDYTAKQRTTVIKNLIATILLALSIRLTEDDCDDKGIPHLMNRWQEIIISQVFLALASLKECDSAHDLTTAWKKAVAKQLNFNLSGDTMPSTALVKSHKELAVAFEVQQILAPALNGSSAKHLMADVIDDFVDDFHRKLYQTVVKPYIRSAQLGTFSAFFHGIFQSELKALKEYQSRFVHALKVIQTELPAVKTTTSQESFHLQLSLINTCLYAHLLDMVNAMKWHKEARDFLTSESVTGRKLIHMREPIQESLDGKSLIIMTDTSVEIASSIIDQKEKEIVAQQSEINALNEVKDRLEQINESLTERIEILREGHEVLLQSNKTLREDHAVLLESNHLLVKEFNEMKTAVSVLESQQSDISQASIPLVSQQGIFSPITLSESFVAGPAGEAKMSVA